MPSKPMQLHRNKQFPFLFTILTSPSARWYTRNFPFFVASLWKHSKFLPAIYTDCKCPDGCVKPSLYLPFAKYQQRWCWTASMVPLAPSKKCKC
jgi:hypothetical protein